MENIIDTRQIEPTEDDFIEMEPQVDEWISAAKVFINSSEYDKVIYSAIGLTDQGKLITLLSTFLGFYLENHSSTLDWSDDF
jgi:hypothetical protein